MSPIVRRTAALAIPKCWKLDPSASSQLEGYIGVLLGDRQYYVAGAAAMAMAECCPDRIDLVHQNYRGLVRKLVDMDEWSQLATLKLLTSYARRCFPRRKKGVRVDVNGIEQPSKPAGFYDDGEDISYDATSGSMIEVFGPDDPDLMSLLRASQSLLYSRNSAVIVAVTRLYLATATSTVAPIPTSATRSTLPSSYILSAIGPLIGLLRAPPSIQAVALQQIVQVVLLYPQKFVPYISHFILRSSDSDSVAQTKLETLGLTFPYSSSNSQSLILNEIAEACRSQRPSLAHYAVYNLGRCASTCSTTGNAIGRKRCMKLLIDLITPSNSANPSTYSTTSASALTVLRHLIQADPDTYRNLIIRLATDLDNTSDQPEARASIIWLVGEYCSARNENSGGIAPDVLRILLKAFCEEDVIVKKQIILLAAKVYLHYLNELQQRLSEMDKGKDDQQRETSEQNDNADAALPPKPDITTNQESQIPHLYAYTHSLIRYDTSYSLRDIARMHRALLPDPADVGLLDNSAPLATNMNTQLATLVLLAPKPAPTDPTPSAGLLRYELGSASGVIAAQGGEGVLPGYEVLPVWVEEGQEPDPKLRDESGIGAADAGLSRADPGARKFESSRGDGPLSEEKRAAKEKTLDDWLDEDSDRSSGGTSSPSSEESEAEEPTSEETSSGEETPSETGSQQRLVP